MIDDIRIDVDELEELTIYVRDAIEECLAVRLRGAPRLWTDGRWSIHFDGFPDPHECVCGESLWGTIERAAVRVEELRRSESAAAKSDERLRQAACELLMPGGAA